MPRVPHAVVTAFVFTTVCVVPTEGQEIPPDSATQDALFVFLDCNAPFCDFDHFRREIVWVNWVRDRQDADLHVLLTAQRTGGGGWDFTLDYLGRQAFAGVDKSLEYVSDPNATSAEVREGLTRTLSLGLIQFVESTPVAPRLRILYEAPEAAVVVREESDPWNLWAFRLSANGSLGGESQERSYAVRGSATADRVSEDLKINLRLSGRYSEDEFEIDDSTTITSTTENYTASVLTVWSLGDRWSIGGRANANRSTFFNRDLALTAGPAVEYNIFPYDESTRRQLTFRYVPEVASFNYELETVDGKTSEVLPRHSLIVSAAVQQPWGEIHGSVEGIQYLHDLSVHRIDTFMFFEYRLFRGFSFNLFGSVSRIKDQFFLAAEDLTEEEILLRRRQRETDFRYDLSVGFSYRFGSKFANVVNPRMGGGGFMFFGF